MTELALRAIDLMRREGLSLFVHGMSKSEKFKFSNERSNRKSRSCSSTSTDQHHTGLAQGNIFLSHLGIDYLEVAKAALRCSLPSTALLYAELWQEDFSLEMAKKSGKESLLPGQGGREGAVDKKKIDISFQDSTSKQEALAAVTVLCLILMGSMV